MTSPKERIEFADTLRQNVDHCNYASRTAAPAKERPRINDPLITVRPQPRRKDFQYFILGYVETIECQAANLKIIGNLLKQENYYSEHDQRRQEQVNIVQNMFDGFRYSGPLQKNITSLRIPLNDNVHELQS